MKKKTCTNLSSHDSDGVWANVSELEQEKRGAQIRKSQQSTTIELSRDKFFYDSVGMKFYAISRVEILRNRETCNIYSRIEQKYFEGFRKFLWDICQGGGIYGITSPFFQIYFSIFVY